MKKGVKTQEIINSFSGNVSKTDLIPLVETKQFLQDGDSLFVNQKTGIVSSSLPIDERAVVEYWSNSIFTSKSAEDYNGFLPYAQSRLFYVFRHACDYFKLNKHSKIRIADFASGQGILLDILATYLKESELFGTEHSSYLSEEQLNRGLKVFNTAIGKDTKTMFTADIGFVNWTLSCSASPYDFLQGVRNNLSENGYLVVSESSRILVPFKKPLSYLLTPLHPANTHPWYFSKNSLSALLLVSGFEICYVNRYFDSDVLLIIAQKITYPMSDNQIKVDDYKVIEKFFKEYLKIEQFYSSLG